MKQENYISGGDRTHENQWDRLHRAHEGTEADIYAADAKAEGDFFQRELEAECDGHPAGEYDAMGKTVYCDGSCKKSMDNRSPRVNCKM